MSFSFANLTFSDDHNEDGFGSFLDDFAVNVFLPQIEEKVMQLIQHATVGTYSYNLSGHVIDKVINRLGCFPRCS